MEIRRSRGITKLWVMGVTLALLVSACGSGAGETPDVTKDGAVGAKDANKVKVVTTIAQIAEPLSVIGGERLEVRALMGPGVDPHLYKATQSDIRRLEEADVIFYSGLHLEANMLKAFEEMGKRKPVVAVAEAVPEEKLLRHEGGAVDPHVWFDIDLWKEALDAAVEQLRTFLENEADGKEAAEELEANKIAYFAEMDALKREALDKMSRIPRERRVLVTAHDAFGYFGRMLDIRVVGLQGLSTEDEIGLTDIEDTIAILEEYRVPAVFVESSINPDKINAVLEGARERGLQVRLGGELFSDAMGEAGTDEGTYLGMFRHNVDTIYNALSGEEK